MTVRSEVLVALDSVTALAKRNYADRAPENEPRPYTVVLDHVGQSPQLKGDSRTMARRRLLQVDLWQDSAADDATLATTLENVLDGLRMTAGLRLAVTDSRRIPEPNFGLSHFVFDCETTLLRTGATSTTSSTWHGGF